MATLDSHLLPLVCPDCRAAVRVDGDQLLCAAGHVAGQVRDGIADLTRPREGMEAELISFWSSSHSYYELAREVNTDYGDADHVSHRRLVDALAEAGARSVLDVGCGTAELSSVLANRLPGLEYVGVEVSRLALRTAKTLGRPGEFLAADAECLPFPDGRFDAVVSLYALEHFAHPKEALAEMARVVRPGGLVGVLTLAYDRPTGTIPSIRFGVRSLPRRHPVNVAVYVARRLRFAARQAWKQVRYVVAPSYMSFELVPRPLVLDEDYRSDMDAVHVVSGRSVLRLLRSHGLTVVETSLPGGAAGYLRIPFDFRVIARRESPAR